MSEAKQKATRLMRRKEDVEEEMVRKRAFPRALAAANVRLGRRRKDIMALYRWSVNGD